MIFANVGPDGVIVFEPRADPALSRLPVGSARNKDAKRFKEIVSVNARHHYDGVTLLVPRMPEARNNDERLAALNFFRQVIEMRMAGETGWPEVPPALSDPFPA